MKIAGTVQHERRELRLYFAIKIFHRARRGGETKVPSPRRRIEGVERKRIAIPRAIEIEMQGGGQRFSAVAKCPLRNVALVPVLSEGFPRPRAHQVECVVPR
jgi:hypothetical protein